MRLDKISGEILDRAEVYRKQWNVPLSEAIQAVLSLSPALQERYTGVRTMSSKTKGIVRIGEFVHRQAMDRMQSNDIDYWQAFHQTLDDDPDLKAIYSGLAPTSIVEGPKITPDATEAQNAGSEIDRLVKRFMHRMNIDDYGWALKQILKANPALMRKYTQV